MRDFAVCIEPAEALNSFLEGSDEYTVKDVQRLFRKAMKAAEETFDVVALRLARLSLKHALTLSTSRVLASIGDALPGTFVTTLIRSGLRTFLPPQYVLLKDRKLLETEENSLLALPTSTGKTLLGELCMARAAREGARTCYLCHRIGRPNR